MNGIKAVMDGRRVQGNFFLDTLLRLKEAFVATTLTKREIVIIGIEAFMTVDSRTPNARN